MRYTAPRDMTVASTCGLSIELKKGVPTKCPPGMHDELLALGVVPEEAKPEPVAKNGKAAEPSNKDARYAALIAAFEVIALRNKREEFNAVGAPHNAVLAEELGWTVSGKERDASWAKWQDEIAPK